MQQKYDLKGSVRNRHVQATGRTDEVLLDENLRQSMFRPYRDMADASDEHIKSF